MDRDKNFGHRRSIRLQGYDYSSVGCYFITICTQHRICILGRVQQGVMVLNEIGQMVDKWIRELDANISYIRIPSYVVMPNHLHFIIQIENDTSVTVGDVVQRFKAFSTNEYINNVKCLAWQPFDKRVWQRNYYEHIIRNQESYDMIAEYIANNPINWTKDKFYAS